MALPIGKRILMRGNEAIAYGALLAGLEAYFAYPITPSTEVPETFAREYGRPGWPDFKVFMQASSEIEAISMTLGSAATGLKSMTFTSSPGFSLKQEGISYAAAMQVPMVIGNVNRGGPGLGNIAAEQSDYHQATKGGGHGGYRLIVLAPATVQEIALFPSLAFDLAYRYRTPVVIVMDAFTGQLKEDVELPGIEKRSYDTSWALTGAKGRGNRVLNSLYLEVEEMEAYSNQLNDKWKRIADAEVRCDEWACREADVIVIAYGLCARIAKAAVKQLRKEGLSVGILRLITLWPFPHERIYALGGMSKRFVVAELNHGQVVEDVKRALFGVGPVVVESLTRCGGSYFSVAEAMAKIRSVAAMPEREG